MFYVSLNKVFLIGRLTKDVEKRTLPSGQSVTNFTLAVTRNYTNKEGTRSTDFVPVIAWGRLAEILRQYTGKGTLVSVAGRLQTRKYQDRNGKNVQVLEVVAEEISFLSKPQDSRVKEVESTSQTDTRGKEPNFADSDFQEITDGDIENLFDDLFEGRE